MGTSEAIFASIVLFTKPCQVSVEYTVVLLTIRRLLIQLIENYCGINLVNMV